jgi:hypothetical protein
MASKDHLEDVKREVLVVGELIEILSGEQKYLQRKLERHIKTVVSVLGGGAVRFGDSGVVETVSGEQKYLQRNLERHMSMVMSESKGGLRWCWWWS